MKTRLENLEDEICRRLGIEDPRYIEIEAKRRVVPEQLDDLRKHLLGLRGVKHQKTVLFFDQFLDTPRMDLFRRGASLRLRYKKDGAYVYLQYKGPGFKRRGLLYRSEFSTERLVHVIMEESHHDMVHFRDPSVLKILADHAVPAMGRAMRRGLGNATMSRITAGNILCIYQKEKFTVELGDAFLEPSLDRIFAFHIGPRGPHPLSTFCEYENEVKAPGGDLWAKLEKVDELLKFDTRLARRFDLRPEPLDKYHRCASFFQPNGRR